MTSRSTALLLAGLLLGACTTSTAYEEAPDGTRRLKDVEISLRSWPGPPEGAPSRRYVLEASEGVVSARMVSGRIGEKRGTVPTEAFVALYTKLLEAGAMDASRLGMRGYADDGGSYYHRVLIREGEGRHEFDAQERRLLGLFVDESAESRLALTNAIAELVGEHATQPAP